ncbi:MarR family winged helix-turn-helix transcriptional regulator [Ornithinimicrobium cavernae]|uniref:MarR family winged helix-turn-helix transcriptional regulator n=1 Tax=Ornithinimicrobium cavernae TaxID=2666047 RepID=UPI00137ACF9F|nr:MarR family transcriptional regulator [Ornithinimicrobium cavernae]
MTDRRDLLGQLLAFTKELRRTEDAAAAEHGLNMWQYAVLSVVEARPGINQAEAASLLDYSRNRIVADLDTLEERGLLVRERGADRRSNALQPTAAGTALMRQVRAGIHRGEDALLATLSAEERADLDRVAGRVARLMRERREASGPSS